MAVKVIFSECTAPYWLDIAMNLKREDGWEPCYWVARAELEEAIRQSFPGTVVHRTMDAIRGIKPADCPEFDAVVLDQALLHDLSVYESTVFGMMDRMDPGYAFAYQERVRLYHVQVKHWLSVMEYYKPDVVVFVTTPHIVYDYILYILCKRQGIKTIIFRTAIEGLVYAVEKFEEFPEAILCLYKELLSSQEPASYKLSPVFENYWKKVSGHSSVATPFYIKDFIKNSQNHNFIKSVLKKLRALPKFIRFIYEPAPPNYIKLRDRKFEDSQMTYLEFLKVCKFEAERKKRQLKSCYNKLAKDVSLDKPYVYVPLSYQPEASTSPDGGVFVNQLLMLDLLSKSLPEGWSLYVKEHITQFSPSTVGERSRTIDFYHDIVSLPNVKLVSLSLSSFDLIDNAKAVANVTGTAGWESVIRGKPALIFGYAWYRGCEGTFYTPTQASCQEALSNIEKGYKLDQQKVKLFIYALQQVCFRGYVHEMYGKIASISPKENAIALTKAIQSLYKNNINE